MKPAVLITGGSSGLGLAIAKLHHLRGDHVIIVGRRKSKLIQAILSIKMSGIDAEVLPRACDISDETDVEALFDSIERTGYRIHLLYNVAGVGRFAVAKDNAKAMLETLLASNFTGLILTCTCALRAMQQQGGTIVNILSSAAKKAKVGESAYCAVKWGARGYTETLQAETKGSNIKVIAVYPGGMDTPFWSPDCGVTPDTSHFLDPNEVARTIVDVCDPENVVRPSELVIER